MDPLDPAPVDPLDVARTLIDIDSTTGREGEAGGRLASLLRRRGYDVAEQAVSPGRFNLFARLAGPPRVVFSTHYDCVPPFFPSRLENGTLYGRGSCDAKGILAAQLAAAERLRAAGENRIALLFVVGEERGSDGARVANDHAPAGVEYLINGEPTDNRLGCATRGVLRVKLRATGRAAHSSYPELGESAIDKLLDALQAIRQLPLPDDPVLGRTHYTVGLIEGGIAPNVVPPHAAAELLFRIVGDAGEVRALLAGIEPLVAIEDVLDIPAVRLFVVPSFETAVFPYTTDIPLLGRWGTPLLLGPGSVHVAHTDHEHVSLDELRAAVGHYAALATHLLR